MGRKRVYASNADRMKAYRQRIRETKNRLRREQIEKYRQRYAIPSTDSRTEQLENVSKFLLEENGIKPKDTLEDIDVYSGTIYEWIGKLSEEYNGRIDIGHTTTIGLGENTLEVSFNHRERLRFDLYTETIESIKDKILSAIQKYLLMGSIPDNTPNKEIVKEDTPYKPSKTWSIAPLDK
jgi:hypothetical protein